MMRKVATALAVCGALLAASNSIEPVSAQNACASMATTLQVCGRTFKWTSAPGGSYVLRCPAAAQDAQTNDIMMGSYGPSGDPNWRTCGDYDSGTYGSCEVGSNQIWFYRGGPTNRPTLRAGVPLTFSATRSALQFPFCSPPGSASCAGCSSTATVQFVFEDTAGFQSAPSATATAVAPTCSADGASVSGSQSVSFNIHLDAPPADSPSMGANNNLDASTQLTGADSTSGAPITNFGTGTGQTNNAAMNVLVVDQAGAGTVATVENVAFDVEGNANGVVVALPAEYSAANARTSLSLNVVLRSRSTGLSSSFSAAVPVTLQRCTPPAAPVASSSASASPTTPDAGTSTASSSTPTVPTQPSLGQGGQEVSSTGLLVAVPDNSDSNTPATATSSTAATATTPATTNPTTTTPSTGNPTTTTSTGATTSNGGGGSTTPTTSTPTQGGSDSTDGSVTTDAPSAAAGTATASVLALAMAATLAMLA